MDQSKRRSSPAQIWFDNLNPKDPYISPHSNFHKLKFQFNQEKTHGKKTEKSNAGQTKMEADPQVSDKNKKA